MKHIKKSWESPVKSMQTFTPQEFIAACYKFCCDCESYVADNTAAAGFPGVFPVIYKRCEDSPGDLIGSGCYEEIENPGTIHHGRACTHGLSSTYCHTTNSGIGGNLWNEDEQWYYSINGQIVKKPANMGYPTSYHVRTGVTFGPQQMIYFVENGKTHYGRQMPLDENDALYGNINAT